MHYYQFNIADYRKDTQHLSLIEHSIYRSLIDTYYLEESPLCSDAAKLMRTHSVRTDTEREAFNNVIADFFVLTDDGYRNSKCDEELSKIYDKSEKARNSAKKRWAKKANVMRTHSEGSANGMLPNTYNPTPNTQEPKKENGGNPPTPVKPKKSNRFIPPTVEQVGEYCNQRANGINPQKFVDYYSTNGWMRGKNKIKDWKACVRTWEQRNEEQKPLETKTNDLLTDTSWADELNLDLGQQDGELIAGQLSGVEELSAGRSQTVPELIQAGANTGDAGNRGELGFYDRQGNEKGKSRW